MVSTGQALIEQSVISLDPCCPIRYDLFILASVVSTAKHNKAIGLITYRLFCCVSFAPIAQLVRAVVIFATRVAFKVLPFEPCCFGAYINEGTKLTISHVRNSVGFFMPSVWQ